MATDLFDIGAKYGRVGTAVGNVANAFVEDSNKTKIDALLKKYNDPMAFEFQGMSPAEKTSKLSRLLYPLDPTMSQRYEQIANTERVKEEAQKREDIQNATIASAFEKPRTEYEGQKKTYEADKTKFLADKVNWDSTATTIDGLKKELDDATNDLKSLMAYKEQYGNPTGEIPSWKSPESWNKPILPTINVSEGENPSYMSKYTRPPVMQPKENR